MEYLVFGMHHLNITQSGTMIDGKPNLSHPNMAIDLAGEDPYVDFFYNKQRETYFYCSGMFGSVSTGNTRFFVTCDKNGRQKKVMCADGVERVITMAMTHSSRSFELYKIYAPGEILYQEGRAGRATGNHIHFEVAEGSQKTKYYDAKLRVYRMKNELNPVNVMCILDGYTKVVSTHGLSFKHVSDVAASKESEGDEAKVTFNATREAVRIRKSPVDGGILKYLPKGKSAEVISFTDGFQKDGYQWVKVKYDGVTGYCQMDMKYYQLNI